MTTDFSVDLSTNTFKFGSIANGQVTGLKADLHLSSEISDLPFGGLLEGKFVGEIKGEKTIPLTIPHKSEEKEVCTIVIVGAGGTGGYLIRDLSRFIFALREKGDHREFQIKIVDGDIVEEKNVLRQNFTLKDIGKYKAEVMARRYSSAFGLEMESVTKMIENYPDLAELFKRDRDPRSQQKILIGCVDNNKARRIFQDYLKVNRAYWIDSGNETRSGQVTIGFGDYRARNYRLPLKNLAFKMPNVTHLYPEILKPSEDDTTNLEVSCAERAMVDTQNIFVNMTAAGHLLNFVRQVVLSEPITINSIEFNTKGVTEVQHITESYLGNLNSKLLNTGV